MKSSRRKRHLLRLLDQRPDDFRMTMALIDRRVRREEIKVFMSVDVPNARAPPFRQDDGKRMVVVRSVLVFEFDKRGGEGRQLGFVDCRGEGPDSGG